MDKQALFSVVIPAYNAEKYIKRCILSVLSQPVPVQAVIVDDGSADSTGEICDSFADDHRVTVIHQKNGGVSAARNEGLRFASGQYVSFLDADDYYFSDALLDIEQAIRLHNEPDLVIGRYKEIYEGGGQHIDDVELDADKITGKTTLEVISYIKSIRFQYAPVRYFIKSKLFEENDLFFQPGIVHEDELWVPHLLCSAKSFACVEKPFYCSITHEGSIMTTRNFKKLSDRLVVAAELQKRQLSSDSLELSEFYRSRVRELAYSAATECVSYSKKEIASVANECAELARSDRDLLSDAHGALGFFVKKFGYKTGICLSARCVKLVRAINRE